MAKAKQILPENIPPAEPGVAAVTVEAQHVSIETEAKVERMPVAGDNTTLPSYPVGTGVIEAQPTFPAPVLDQRGPQKPTIGRVVIFKLSGKNAEEINRRRTTPHSIAERIKLSWQNQVMWPLGAQAHIGSEVKAGDELPAIVVRVDEDAANHLAGVNLKVFLDGSDDYWTQAVVEGGGDGQWHWPVRG